MTLPGSPLDATRTVDIVLNAPVQGYVAGLTQAEVVTNSFASAVDHLDARLSGLTKRAGKKLIHFSEADFAALGGATASAATLEKQLGTLNATSVVTQTSMSGIKGSVEGAFTKFPIARSSVIGLTEAISGLGVTGARDLGALTQTFIKLGAAAGEPMSDLAQGTIQLSRLMGVTGSQQIGNYANSLLTVSKNAGVSATGVLSFAQAIAPLARQAGIGEAAVLGISTAFSKAGADGYVAANTFNSIVGDITQLTQSGSPELSKYANLIGVTVDQFRRMDKTTAIEKIFTTIAHQGPKAITTLNQLGIDGVRAQSAIAGVVQSGNLQQSIDQAMGASHDQKNLNAGSRAAFDDWADSLVTLRNNFTQFGTEIGTTFLRPLDAATHSVNSLFGAVNQLIKPFTPLIAVLGEAAGVVGAVGGVALGAAGLIGTVALARTAIRGGPVRGLREGVAAGRGMVPGETAAETAARLQGNQSAARYAAGTLPLRARLPYAAGTYLGRQLGESTAVPGDPNLFRQSARALVRSPFRVGAYLANSQATFLSDAARNDYQRSVYQRAASGEAAGSSLRGNIAAAAEENRLNAARLSTTRAVIGETGRLGSALAGLTAETAKAGISMAGGAAGRGIARGGSALTSALFSPTAMIGLPVGLELYSRMRSNLAQGQAQDTEDLNPIAKYNDALGIATTNLASFAAAVNTAATGTQNLNGVTQASSLGSVAVDTRSDVQSVQGQKSSDTAISALAGSRGGRTNAAALRQLAMSYNFTDPRQLQLFKNNANAAGFDQATVTAALSAAVAAQGGQGTAANPLAVADYSAVARSVQSTEGRTSGLGRLLGPNVGVNNQSRSGEALRDSVLSGIGTAANSNQRYGADFAAQKKFADQLAYFGAYAGNFSGRVRGGKDNAEMVRRKELANALATTFQGSQQDYQRALDRIDFSGMTDQQRQQAIVSAIGATAQGKAQLGSLSTTDVSKMPAVLRGLYGSGQTSATNQAIQGVGPLGGFALANRSVQYASQNVGNTNAAYAGTLALAGQAMRSGGSFSGAVEALDKLKAAIQNVNDPLYQMADAARSYVQQQRQYQLPTLSRSGATRSIGDEYRAAQANFARSAAANGGAASPDASAGLASAQQSYQQNKESQRQYLVSTLQTAQNYGIQMQRSQQDQDKTIFRQHRDFLISMAQSEQDYRRQTLRSQRDFGIQMARQAESSAQSIYDPFTRVSAQYTADAGTTIQNLEDQNQRIAQQLHQLQQLRDAGVSQQAIDTLQLSAPGKAQQLNNLVDSLAQNPQLVNQINSLVAIRVKATAALTQSSFTETFRNTVADFRRGLSDTARDYEIAHQRAVDAQRRSLSDMATDYHTMVRRSGDDLKLAMTEIYGSFGDVFSRSMAIVTQSVGKYAPQAAKTIQTELDKLRQDNPDLFNPSYGGTALPGTVGGKDTKGRTIVDNSTVGPIDQSKFVRLADAAHAMGGISVLAHTAAISEGNRPEAIIPLDQRGLAFMSGFASQVSMEMLRQMRTAQHPSFHTGAQSGTGVQNLDMRTMITGPITITASTIEEFKAELTREARSRRLRSPTAGTSGALS